MAFSMSAALEMVRHRTELCTGPEYGSVTLLRPDTMIWGKDIELASYNRGVVSINAANRQGKGHGDFMFVMDAARARRFGDIGLEAMMGRWSRSTFEWGWIPDFVASYVTPGIEAAQTGFVPCRHIEVLRKLCSCFPDGAPAHIEAMPCGAQAR